MNMLLWILASIFAFVVFVGAILFLISVVAAISNRNKGMIIFGLKVLLVAVIAYFLLGSLLLNAIFKVFKF